jgi:NADH-quinone oxidoreductase subunit A
MLGSYIPILVMMIVATLLALGMVIASAVLGPKHPTKYKSASYECGMTPVGSARERFPIKFYLIAMLFIIFDIETIFLYPWAVVFRGVYADRASKIFLLGEMGVFVGILFIGYFYILGKGALDWDEGRAPEEKLDKKVFAPRKPIRFGNESGSVKLPALVQTSTQDYFGTTVDEEKHAPALTGSGKG